MRPHELLALAALLGTTLATAQDAGEPPPPPALAEALRLGRPMVIAPLCGVRDGAWASDLRRTLESRATAPSGTAQGALGYAEAEALEDFASTLPAATCASLAHSTELKDADQLVTEWRARPAS